MNSNSFSFGLWEESDISNATWTNIMSFSLSSGRHMIFWSFNVTSANVVSGSPIMGTRISYSSGAESQKLEYFISGQQNAMSFFTMLNLTKTDTVNIQFFHNTGQVVNVGRRHACAIPVYNTKLNT